MTCWDSTEISWTIRKPDGCPCRSTAPQVRGLSTLFSLLFMDRRYVLDSFLLSSSDAMQGKTLTTLANSVNGQATSMTLKAKDAVNSEVRRSRIHSPHLI